MLVVFFGSNGCESLDRELLRDGLGGYGDQSLGRALPCERQRAVGSNSLNVR